MKLKERARRLSSAHLDIILNHYDKSSGKERVRPPISEASYFPMGPPTSLASNTKITPLPHPWAKPGVPVGQKKQLGLKSISIG